MRSDERNSRMQFREHMFEQEVPAGLEDTRTIQRQGFIGVETGLGCIQVKLSNVPEAYGLVHVASGMGLVDMHFGPFAENKAIAERWVELLAPLLDWNRPIREISQDRERLGGNPVLEALRQAGGREIHRDSSLIGSGVPEGAPDEE